MFYLNIAIMKCFCVPLGESYCLSHSCYLCSLFILEHSKKGCEFSPLMAFFFELFTMPLWLDGVAPPLVGILLCVLGVGVLKCVLRV